MKTYTIIPEQRVANSPFFVEGSDMKFDITHEFPIPTETIAFTEDNEPVAIRFIAGCKTIFRDEQVKQGWPEVRKPSQTERKLCTFIGGMLSVPKGYAHLETYLETAGWYVDQNHPQRVRPADTRAIYTEHNQDQIEEDLLENEQMVNEARQLVLNGRKEQLIPVLRLARNGAIVDPNINIKTLRLQLLEIANINPDFILKGSKTAKNDLIVLISKATDYKILDMDTTGQIRMQSKTDSNKYSILTKVADMGNRSQKVERAVQFFESEKGLPLVADMKKRIEAFEEANNLNDDEEEQGGEANPGAEDQAKAANLSAPTLL